MEAFEGGDVMSNATKGSERELFVRAFLSQAFGPMHRFGTGDITDSYRERSGQVDIIVPFPDVALSFPMYPEGPRLFLAESVVAAIEIKSDIANQWNEVLSTAAKVKKLRRRFKRQNLLTTAHHLQTAPSPPGTPPDPKRAELAKQFLQEADTLVHEPGERIPVFAVGFKGWKTRETIQENLQGSNVDAVLVLDAMLFESGPPYLRTSTEVWSLMAFLETIEQELSQRVTRDSATYSYQIAAAFEPPAG